MNKLHTLGIISLLFFVGCAGPNGSKDHNYAVLRDLGRGCSEVTIINRQWDGLWGPSGYVGFRDNSYSVVLEGSGPTYINPPFIDNPPCRCVGTVAVDREHNRVTVDMRRIASKPEEPEHMQLHPANGTYSIRSVIRLTPKEQEIWFKDWDTNSMGSRKQDTNWR